MLSQEARHQFTSLYIRFRQREAELPPQVKWKLEYIARRVNGQISQEKVDQDKELQIRDLQLLDQRSLILVFNTIASTLLIENGVSNQSCKIKKKGIFQVWKNASISFTETTISIATEKSAKKYKIAEIILNHYKKGKQFEISNHKDLDIIVKFAKEELTKNIYQKLRGVIHKFLNERTSVINKEKMQLKSQPYLSNELKLIADHQSQIYGQQNNPNEQIGFNQSLMLNSHRIESSRKSKSQPEIKIHQLAFQNPPQGFKIIEKTKNSFISQHLKESKLYIEILIHSKEDPLKLLSYFVQQKQWNSVIMQQKITRLSGINDSNNTFCVYRSYSNCLAFTKQRQSLTKVGLNKNNNGYTLNQQNYRAQKQQKYTRCILNNLTNLFIFQKGVKLVIDSYFHAQGYCQLKDSQMLHFQMFEEIKYFEDNYKIYKIKKTECLNLFESGSSEQEEKIQKSFANNFIQRQLANDEFEESDDLSVGSKQIKKNIETQQTLEMQKPLTMNKRDNIPQLIRLRSTNATRPPSLQYIDLVIKKQFEKCYVNKRYDFKLLDKYDEYMPRYCLSEMLKRGGEYQINKNLELVYINQNVLGDQKNTLKFIITQMGANLFAGKSVLNVSLPVVIFQSQSLLQRSAASFGCSPDYLCPIADADPLTQMKNITTFLASIPTFELVMLKPFNPILGETFQGYLKGIQIVYEQISHHPPISAYYMQCDQFKLYGNLIAFADVSLNSAVGGNIGTMHIQFKNGTHFQCFFPPCEISGLIYGDRKFRAYGKGFIIQKKQRLFAQFSIEKIKKGIYDKNEGENLRAGDLIGGIFQVNDTFISKFSALTSVKKFAGVFKQDIEQKLSTIRGVWFKQIYIDGQLMNKEVKKYPLQYSQTVLPSDSNFRLDILYHKQNDLQSSQKMKEHYEEVQRGDRKLREKWTKILKKKK